MAGRAIISEKEASSMVKSHAGSDYKCQGRLELSLALTTTSAVTELSVIMDKDGPSTDSADKLWRKWKDCIQK